MPIAERPATRHRLTRLTALLVATLTAAVTTFGAAILPAAAVDPPPVPSDDPATVTADGLPTWQINGVVWSQAVAGNTVYVTGSFTKARPPGTAVGSASEIAAPNIFAYDITTGNPVTFNHSLNAQGLVVSTNPDRSRVYVGGDFTTVDGQPRQHIAAFDTATGALVADFAPATDGQVRGFAFAGSTVYLGGNFRVVNGTPRRLLAAYDLTSKKLLPWSPTVDNGFVWTMVMSPDNSRVLVGGSFTTLNGVSAYGSGALNATTGATEAWAANLRLRAAGANGAITSLRTDGVQVYGSGYAFGAGAAFEGTFGADPKTGAINWVNDCLGDTYDVFPMGQVLYNVSHRHNCGNIGYFPDTSPRSRWMKATADRTFPIGKITTKDAYGWDFTGLQYSGLLHWYPDLKFGTYTAAGQAAWSVTGNADYVVLGGEFPTVNGIPQQGLVRFTKRPKGPHAIGPANNTGFTPSAVSNESGRVKVMFGSVSDKDDTTISYAIYRSPSVRIGSITRKDSEFWKLPTLGFTDAEAAPGSSVRYQVQAKDSDGNTKWSAWSPYITVSSAPPSAYAGAVRASNPSHLWRLNESSGTGLLLDEIGDLHGTPSSYTLGVPGALIGESTGAASSSGGSTPKITTKDQVPSDDAVSVEAWVKTTSTRGGRIVGFGDSASGTSSTNNTDRVLYLDTSGRPNFAINDGSYRTVYSTSGINDGQWHHVVGEVGPDGMQLFVDGIQAAGDQNATAPKPYAGYWRIGADQTTNFANRPSDAGLAGTIDEVAVYPAVLSEHDIRNHYSKSGRALANRPPVAAFSSTVGGLKVSVDGADSTVAEGAVASYAWTYGDGSTGTGASDTHTYAKAGTYPVKLTVTDADGATDSVSHDVTVSAATELASDAFDRTLTSGWGAADRGGNWSIGSNASKFSVADGQGKVTAAANAGYTATLPGVSATDLETSMSMSIDKAATGGGQYLSMIGRQIAGAGDYRAKVRVLSTGAVSLSLTRLVGSTETALAGQTVSGLTYAPGQRLQIRMQVTGNGTSTLKAKVWKSTDSEPSAWTTMTTDSTSTLQGTGTVGVAPYLSGSTTNGPVVYSFDQFKAGVPE